ncbi:MAG TPA: L,D-transpeptidase family protein [Prosthecobacter sp.]|nr:L,D-transpeptidase family protein [Prosthecobacter sp.]
MKTFLPATVTAAALLISTLAPAAKESAKPSRSPADVETAVRLQVFLDRAEFGPGKIDGHFGEFTRHALRLYREANGLPPLPEPEAPKNGAKSEPPPPAITDMDLASIGEPFTQYTLSDGDLEEVGELPKEIEAQAKLKWLPYQSAAEAVAERFHCDADFLTELNPGVDLKQLKAGDKVTVPNVTPFVIEKVKDKADEESSQKGSNNIDDKEEKKGQPAQIPVSITIDMATNMLQFFDGDRLAAAFPVTVGSGETTSPIGDWKVRQVYHLPHFRYDKQMLKRGERSDDFHILKPGPNNLVGVVWIALNKKGIGIHGTAEPDSIGRSASHGCIRLANWDAVRLAARVQPGMAVSIH